MALSTADLQFKLSEHEIDRASFEELWEVDGAKVYGLTVFGGSAIEIWGKLYQIVAETGYYPVVLGDRNEEVEISIDRIRCEENAVEQILSQSNHLDADRWLADTARERREDLEQCWVEEKEYAPDFQVNRDAIDPLTLAEIGVWNDEIEADNEYTIPFNINNGEPIAKVAIALIPTVISWQVFAFIKFGNWNACPSPSEHIAIAKKWYRQYGAEVVGISNDVVEMRVTKPPLDRDAAFALAQEQYIYCEDIVSQGTGTLMKLASALLDGEVWYFWWD
jgi:hypothetical protein